MHRLCGLTRDQAKQQQPKSLFSHCFCQGRGGYLFCSLPERMHAVLIENEISARLSTACQLAEGFNLDFQEILDSTLRRFPPNSVKALCAKLKLPYPD
jgi:hypothetical protein